MRSAWMKAASARAAVAALFAAAALTGAGPAMASTAPCVALTGAQPPNPDEANNFLNGVAVLSPCDAWAVGDDGGASFEGLIEHWNGATWQELEAPSVSPAGSVELNGVTATSATSAWAVGFVTDDSEVSHAVILRGDQNSWQQAKSPDLGAAVSGSELNAVRASTASNAWAVGGFTSGDHRDALAERWNGSAWTQVKITSLPASSDAVLDGVTIVSASAWAVGQFATATGSDTLILHWNGSAWTHVPSPNLASANELEAVDASSAGDVWSVGVFGTAPQTLALHCC